MQAAGQTVLSKAGYSPVMAFNAEGDVFNGSGSQHRRTDWVRSARVCRGPP